MAMCSPCADTALPVPGLPIRESTDQKLFNASPWLIAVVHALHRLLVPRHPPCALDILTVIEPLEPKLVWFDETQFLNWPAVQFSRSGRGAIQGDSLDGLSKLSSARAPAAEATELLLHDQVRSTFLGPRARNRAEGPEWSP
jgi:hypothetical protein